MRNTIRECIFGLLACACFAAQVASASIITANFDGLIDNATDDFGLGINVDDVLTGSFSYDSITGAPLHFAAQVGASEFTATNLFTDAQLFDGFLNWYGIRGELSDGLFMSVGLTAGTPVFTSLPPQQLDSDDFVVHAFKIVDHDGLPIGANAAEIESIYSISRFSLKTTVPEPGTLALMTLGALGILLARRKRRQT